MKPDGCRCDGEHKNIYCFITTPPTVTIGDLLQQLGYQRNDDGVRTALEELLDYHEGRKFNGPGPLPETS